MPASINMFGQKAPTLTLLWVVAARAATYSLSDSISGSGFYNAFSFQAISDPTSGRVNYVDQATAQSKNLTYASDDTFILRADDTTVLSSSDPGRDSVRLQSNAQYTNHVAIFSLRHMPQGCGTWPAVWEVGSDWPNNGEIDILEGVNDVSPDQVTLHTSADCTMPSSRSMSGTSTGDNCDVNETNNGGCGVQINQSNNYGPDFNDNGGGWYVLERTSSALNIWFWSRGGGTVPSDVGGGSSSVDTSGWGTPSATFVSSSTCDFSSHLGAHNVIVNLDFCGDWAGAVYSSDGCPGSCTDYVNENPSAFTNAYFDFEWVNIYE